MSSLFLVAALILVFVGLAHSYLGEKYMFGRLFAIPNLPLFRHDRKFTERVLRYAWHLTSLTWWSLGGLLVLLYFQKTELFGWAISSTLMLTGIIIVATCGIRHPAWALFLLAAILVWLGI
jgi:hypothetical protein